jgi:SAM-dependent methyltransferase
MTPKLPRLRAFAEILTASLSHPRLSSLLMHQLPSVIRGRRYGRAWPSPSSATDVACAAAVVNPLEAFFNSRETGRGIWKWTHYFDVYHRHLQKFVGKEVHVLEVGVFSGGSLEMWKEYFGAKCHLYGLDIREECRALQDESTRIFIGDQADRDFWSRFRREVPMLDVLIDDGGHLPEQQIVTLEEMLPHLRPGGVFVCEDVHGEFNEFAAYVRALAANLDTSSQTVKPGSGKHLSSKAASFQADIHSIHFYPYMTVIEKRTSPIREFNAPCHGTEWAWPMRKPAVSKP